MKEFILEACVDSLESAQAAAEGGANRLELCANLIIGGTTPSPCLFREIKKQLDIRIHVLIRPRFGDFCYADSEFRIMLEEVKMFRDLGADGVVLGVLNPDGALNIPRMKLLMEAAGEMSVTLHRAFDLCQDPFQTMEEAKDLGIHTILTSGQKNSCLEGKELLTQLVKREDNRITIMIGGGVNAEVIRILAPATRAKAYHMSGKVIMESEMTYRKKDVNMGLPAFSEYELIRTDKEKIRRVREVLENL